MAEEESSEMELLKAIKDKLADLEDTQLVNKLDIINMKNELDKISLTSSVAPETADKIAELEKLAEKVGTLKKFERAYSDLEKLKSEIERKKPADTSTLKLELDSLRKKISEIESGAPTTPAAVSKEVSKEISNIRNEINKFRSEFGTYREQLEMPEKLQSQIDGLDRKISALATIKPGKIKQKDWKKVLKKIQEIESKKPEKVKGEIPADVLEKVDKIEGLSAQIDSLRSLLDEQSAVISGLGKVKKTKGGAVISPNVLKRVDELEKNVKSLDTLKYEIEKEREEIANLHKDIGALGVVKEPPDLDDLKSRISDLEKRVLELPKKAGRAPDAGELRSVLKNLKTRMADLEKKVVRMPETGEAPGIEEIQGMLEEQKAKISNLKTKLKQLPKVGEDPAFEELKSMLENLRSSFAEQGKEIADLKSGRTKKGATRRKEALETAERLDSISNEISAIKSKMHEVEGKAAKIGMAPEALAELRKLKGEFPVDELTELKNKMTVLEQNLEKLGKLASGLQPIELPDMGGAVAGPSEELENRVKSLEKLVDRGIGPKRFEELENKFEELKSTLPEQIRQDADTQLNKLREETKAKLHELDEIRTDIVESTIDQLLAQPAAVKKFVDTRIKRQVEEMSKKLDAFEKKIRPLDSKVSTMVGESGDKDMELEKIQSTLKDIQANTKKELESLEIEVRALNTRLGTITTSVKGMEGTGVAGLMRDLEILKTKAEWLESIVQKFDLKPLYDKIEDLEARIGTAGMAGGQPAPYIIE